MAHGTPARAEDIESFYTQIRRGRPPSEVELAELVRRYEAIGGQSPFAARTQAQVDGLGAALDAERFVVALGQKFAAPEIPDAVQQLVGAGVERIIGVVLAPHYSRASVGDYMERARDAIGERVPFHPIDAWHDEPALIGLLADRVREVWIDDATLLVTAHSLPLAAIGEETSYVDGLNETARLLSAATGITGARIAWQSAARSPVPWLEPSLLDAIRAAAADGAAAVVVCPAGFTSEHLEVAYDLDIEAAALASELGVGFARTRSLDADPAFCALLADLVQRPGAT